MLTERGAAAPAPRHDAVTDVEPAQLIALFEKMPDVFDVVVIHREVGRRFALGVVPAHPLSHADGLLRDALGVLLDAGAAGAGEIFQAELYDVLLGVKPKLFFDLDLEPQPLTIEAVLPALIVALHGFVAAVDVFIGAPPSVMDAHGIVGGNRSVDKRPARAAGVLRAQFGKNVLLLPETQDAVFQLGIIDVPSERFEHHPDCTSLSTGPGRSSLI